MRFRSLSLLIRQNLRRNLRHNALSAIGIIVGIGSFTFFLALDSGIRRVVLGDIFPVDRIEVVPPTSTLLGDARVLNDAMLDNLRNPRIRSGVKPKAVYAKMKLALPSRGWGGKGLLNRTRDFYFELSGFCDGVDEDVIRSEVLAPFEFVDEFKDNAGGPHKPKPCAPGNLCPDGYYCAWDVYECHRPVPVVISKHMIELYNGSIAKAHPGLPKIPNFLTSVFRGQSFTVELGQSYLGNRAKQGGAPIQRRFQLVGISDKAVPLGITIPLGYVKRWNQRYAGELEASSYSSAVLIVNNKRDITPLIAYVKTMGFDIAESEGEKIGLFITLATLLFSFISLIIVLMAAINISHTFMMLISERRREIGVFRAVGATRRHIRQVILGEASVVGLVGGALGVGLAFGTAAVCNWVSAHYLPDFPFKPESYFYFHPLLLCGALGFAVIFCVLGALFPAIRAARMEPASSLASLFTP